MSQTATNLGKTFLAAAKEMRAESANLAFLGRKYEVRVLNEGTDREQLMIFKRHRNAEGIWVREWGKPLVVGG